MTGTAPKNLAQSILSGNLFKNVNTQALAARYDVSQTLCDVFLKASGVAQPTVQTGNTISSIPPQGIEINQPGTY